MRGLLAVVVALGGCVSSVAATTTPPHADATALPSTASVMREEMAWEVFWQGLAIGRAELSVGATSRATFTTNRLARMLASARYELTADPAHARERIVLRGDATEHTVAIAGARYRVDARTGTSNDVRGDMRGRTSNDPRGGTSNDVHGRTSNDMRGRTSNDVRGRTNYDVRGRMANDMRTVPGGTPLHTLTSVLAAIRVWASVDAGRAYAWVIVDGELYRLDLARPVRERLDGTRTLRVDGVIRALDPDGARVDLQVWLAERNDRSPLRVVVETGGERVVAQLAETSLTAR